MHDNTLVRALQKLGYKNISLVPTYTPIRTDEDDVSVDQVFFGGINVFLQQSIPVFRWLPNFLDRFLDHPRIIRRATSRSIEIRPAMLGELAVSMLKGTEGNQRKEVNRLASWMAKTEQTDLVVFSNLLIGGVIPEIKKRLGIPVVVTLQGDDMFLDSLPEKYRKQCIQLMSQIGEQVDAFVCHSEFYKQYMADYLQVDSNKIFVTPLGLDTVDFETLNVWGDRAESQASPDSQSNKFVIGYLARLAPEKGLDLLIDAFIQAKQSDDDLAGLKLSVAGWLGDDDKQFADEQFAKLDAAGLQDDYEYVGSVSRQEKLDFLKRLDLFCVPARFQEPKGIYALEALAAGLPVLAPRHGAFPELLSEVANEALFDCDKDAVQNLTQRILQFSRSSETCQRIAGAGRELVFSHRNCHEMALATSAIFEKLLSGSG